MRVANWIQAAEDDMRAAEALLKAHLPAMAIFHCQQAVEKALKAICLRRQHRYPPRHELDALAEAAGIWEEIRNRDLLAVLEAAYTACRYPEDDTYRALNSQSARKIVAQTRRMVRWLCKQV